VTGSVTTTTSLGTTTFYFRMSPRSIARQQEPTKNTCIHRHQTTWIRTSTSLQHPRDSHIKQLIQHTRQQDENGKMDMTLDYGQLLASINYLILQHPKPKLPHIKDLLITTIRQFLGDSQLNIVIPDLYTPKPLREPEHYG
jgi:hypothetical protein